MTRALLGSLAVVVAVAFAVTGQDKEKPRDDKPAIPKPETLAEQVQRFDKLNRRGCGAKLTLSKAELVSVDKVGEVLRVHWEIDYTGPRPPLTICKPNMQAGPEDRTRLCFHYQDGKTDVGRQSYLRNPREKGIYFVGKDDFATAEKGKNTVSGVFDVPASPRGGSPDESRVNQIRFIRPFYVQLTFNPQERGGQFDLDAYTGELMSNVIEVTESKK